MRADLKKRTTVNSARAPSPDTLGILGSTSPICVSHESGCFKENININKSEAPKLAVEPLQMKRKKKGGGYNLRKSLAWDRAFFTEEGVLDPQELSIISTGASRVEGLASINEDTPCRSQLSIDAVDLQNLENSISKNLRGQDDRKKDPLSGNLDSTTSSITRSTTLASHKVPTHVDGKLGFRSDDCSRPSSSSSLKRAANVNVGKAAGKELKLPKVPGLKPSFSPICGTTKRNILGVNCVKHNQIAQPDIHIQGIVGLKNSSKFLKNSEIASKVSPQLSVSNGDGNLGNSSFRRNSSANVSPALVHRVDSLGSKRSSDYNTAPATPVISSEGLTKPATAPLARNAQLSGRTMHHFQNQPMKPSGLRMPSPSLSFFSQPKRPVLPDLPLRDNRTSDVCGSQKTENLRLQYNLRTTPKVDYEIQQSTIRSNKSLSSRSDFMAPCHLNADWVTNLNLESSSIKEVGMKVQEQSKKSIAERVSSGEVEMLKIDIEVPSLGETHEKMMEDNFLKVIGNSPIKSESCQSGCRYPELRLEQNNAINKSEKDNKPDDRMHNSLTMRSDWQETCKPDCHEPHTEKAEHFKYSLSENERTSIGALGYSRTQTEDSYIGAKQLHADLLDEAARTDTSTDNLFVVEACKQNVVSGGTNNNSTFILEDENKQSGNGSEVEKESCGSGMLTTCEGMLLEKHTCQNSLLKNNAENLLFVFPIKRGGNELPKPTSSNLLSSGKMHDCSSDKDFTTKALTSTESDSVGNFVSPESYENLRNPSNYDGKTEGSANSDASLNETIMPVVAVDGEWQDDDNLRCNQTKNVMLNSTPSKNTSNSFCQDTHRKEIGNCSSFPESRNHDVMSLDNNLETVTEVGPSMQDDSASNWLTTLEMSSNERISDMDNLRNIQESGILMVQKEVCLCNLEEPSISAQESPLKHDSCDAYGSDGQSPVADAITYSSRVEPFCDSSKTEVSEVSNSSFISLHPVLEHVNVEAESVPSNKHEDGVDEKTRSFVLPLDAVPFSDEWLAAIEAAGEDILTKKSGAVQNSPPDKSLPEPSPWSPVKKKNNQIGPFDCTKKFSNVHPSNFN